jgi:hypothetical protein
MKGSDVKSAFESFYHKGKESFTTESTSNIAVG